jgi:hypothetical protein
MYSFLFRGRFLATGLYATILCKGSKSIFSCLHRQDNTYTNLVKVINFRMKLETVYKWQTEFSASILQEVAKLACLFKGVIQIYTDKIIYSEDI